MKVSGVVHDATSSNVMVSGYCKSEEINKPLLVLDIMIVLPCHSQYDLALSLRSCETRASHGEKCWQGDEASRLNDCMLKAPHSARNSSYIVPFLQTPSFQ
ncbi:hypothetical protein Bca52824_088074 [Brassica carinata]|uniref:Uncharacterized protein n=2 Tax=Brassica TaxID=3705 RepID=A0A8S9QLS9_BRACR|nr:hypothetical protein F2Q69_00019397 [Brassica cretica]KAG2248446.1 hypothetical protein Bca52824_088074 [Brassica carinata]